jgi:hypothetical protein
MGLLLRQGPFFMRRVTAFPLLHAAHNGKHERR